MEWSELRIELIKINKDIKWLVEQLGYSRTYLYRVFELQHNAEISRIKKILSEVQ
jgi:hypothetical protein